MFCKFCGKEIMYDSTTCQFCGNEIKSDVAEVSAREPISYSPRRKKIFGFSIAALACSTIFTIVGIILGRIAWKQGDEDLQPHRRDWMVRVGRIVGKVSFFIAIGYTFFWVIYIVFFIMIYLTTNSGSVLPSINNFNY